MSRVVLRFAAASGALLIMAALASAQQTTTTTQTKAFEVIAVQGNDLVVKLPEGTRELDVPEDFRFVVDGQQLSVHDLKPGMKGTAQITTKTTLHPVTVTEVKNGTVRQVSGSSIIVQTDQGFKSFTEGELDKRGVKLVKDGKPAELSDFHAGDMLTATIITSRPPKVVTEKQVQATLARSGNAAGSGSSGSSTGSSTRSSAAPSASGSSTASSRSTTSGSSQSAPGSSSGRKLPKTASQLPLLGLIGICAIGIALALTAVRRGLAR